MEESDFGRALELPGVEKGPVKLNISTNRGLVTVRARQFGALAVHRSAMTRDSFTITHIATGHAVYSHFPSDAEALFFAKRLAILPIWNFKHPSSAKRRMTAFKTAWNAIDQEWQALQRQPTNQRRAKNKKTKWS
jgi:hypothetical protein